MAYLDKSIIKSDSKLVDTSKYISFTDSSSGMLELQTDAGLTYNPLTETLIITNLTVNGTTTTINTETINLADNIITLNSNISAATAPTENGGIEIKRGNSAAAILRWNETNDRWEFTNDGTTYHEMLITGEYVSSVGLSLPTSVFTLSGSPVTSTGTLTGTFKSQTAKTFFAAPNAADGTPLFRGIVASDLPTASISAAGIVSTTTQEFLGAKTIRAAASQDGVSLMGRGGGVGGYTAVLTPAVLTADQTITLPNKTGTLALMSDIISGTASQVANPMTLKIKTGTTEGTDLYTFDGSAAKTLDFKAGTNISLTTAVGSVTISATDTTYSPGTGLDLSGTTFNVDLSELSTSTTNADGAYFIVTAGSTDGSAQYKLTKANIALSGFNNDSGWTSNTGTVTSVGGTGTVSGLTLTGTVTTTGSLTLGGTLSVSASNFSSQTANTVLASPNGSAGVPTFRTIVSADLPTASITVAGIVSISTQEFAGTKTFRAAATQDGITLSGRAGGTSSYRAILTPDVLTADRTFTLPNKTGTFALTSDNISGTATNVTGIVAVANGGTGTSTAPIQGGIIYGSSTTAYASTAVGIARQVLTSNGTSAPTWAELDMSYIPGSTFKKSVLCATTENLAATYATNVLTMSAVGVLTIDGITPALNDRILVKNQTSAAHNGIYYVSTLGTAGVAAILTRTIDGDTSAEIASAMVAVDSGTASGGWVFDNDFKTTDTLGTTAMNWNSMADSGKKLSYFAATTSSELAGVISDETGSGSLVFATSPTITTPVIYDIKAIAATAADLWSEVTTGSIAIGAGLTTGALNLATTGTGATPIGIGHSGSTTTFAGTVVLPTGSTKIGQTTLVQGGAVSITLPTTAGTLYVSGGTDVAVADGGTGVSSWTVGAVWASATTTLTSGVLPIAYGGTGATSTVQGGIVYGASTTAHATTAVGTSGQILKSNATSAPTWVDQSSLSVGTATTAGKVANSLSLKFNTGSTEGTNLYTFDGSAAKTIDIKAGQGIVLTSASNSITISQSESMVIKTAAYTTAPLDSIILADSTTAAFSVTLLNTVLSGTVYRIKKIDSSLNAVTIDAGAGKTIDGSQTFELKYQYQAIDVVYNGSSAWYIL